jgi:serine/threonine protein kinase
MIFYEMLYGVTPWVENTPHNLAMAIKTKPLMFPEDKKISNNTKDLLSKMLVYDDEKRASW